MRADAGTHLVHFEHGDLDVLVLDLDLPAPHLPELTASEREVALATSGGRSNAEIAAARGVSVRTVASQLRSIFRKLGVASRWDLARLVVGRSYAAAAAPTRATFAAARPAPRATVARGMRPRRPRWARRTS